MHWLFYAPSRRKTYADARWCDIDLDAAEWEVVGKNGKVDIFPLAPPLLRSFRTYRRWQLSEAEHHPAMRDALSDPETAYVLMTNNAKKINPSTVTKIPHCFRRAWATIALNDEKNPTPIDVVSEVLRHNEIATTRRHYAPTKSDRAQAALVGMRVS